MPTCSPYCSCLYRANASLQWQRCHFRKLWGELVKELQELGLYTLWKVVWCCISTYLAEQIMKVNSLFSVIYFYKSYLCSRMQVQDSEGRQMDKGSLCYKIKVFLFFENWRKSPSDRCIVCINLVLVLWQVSVAE